MREGCEAFLAGWEDELIEALANRKDSDSAEKRLCHDVSKACTGVDPSNVKPMDDTIMIDGQPRKIVSLVF